LFRLDVYPEDASNIFPRNVVPYIPDHTAYIAVFIVTTVITSSYRKRNFGWPAFNPAQAIVSAIHGDSKLVDFSQGSK
jgi:hypothetical protein